MLIRIVNRLCEVAMFYFLLAPVLTYHWILIIAAIIPAVFLMLKVYRSDRLEKESASVLWRMIQGGILSALLAMVFEWIGQAVLNAAVPKESDAYNVILYFIIVAFSEEGAKYLFLKRRSWYTSEFNCQYDGVVYAVFVSLGFALWENISYVMHYGFSTALVRAVTAIPGHACFGVFMGAFYGLARGCAYLNKNVRSKLFRIFAVVIPASIHGAYDYIATTQTGKGEIVFCVFIAVLFVVSYLLVSRLSKNDHYFRIDRRAFSFVNK